MLSWSNDAQTAFLFQLVFPLRWKTPVEEEEFSNMLFSSYHAMKYHTPSLTLTPLKNFKSLRVNIHGLPLISKACTLPSCFYLKKYYDLPCYLHFSKYVWICKNEILLLYKVRDEKYLLDLQRVSGPQILFLEFCAIFVVLLEAS
ncbi:unnamed protein product [Coffea canephora]|uniref:non-specific serine/threonine protein kinase n=1 Tax=Coffea canephora TaxID=49390 RepID=A0A068VF41_COFCA|nr:unnamed protein product [Coffea canephora]